MPQLDLYSFSTQVNICLLAFSIIYFVGVKSILPKIIISIKLRKKVDPNNFFTSLKKKLLGSIFF